GTEFADDAGVHVNPRLSIQTRKVDLCRLFPADTVHFTPLLTAFSPYLMKVKPCGTKLAKTYAYSITIIPTIEAKAMECQKPNLKILPSFPNWLVAEVAIIMDCASTILPI